jgi:hypothetical protein
MRRPRPTVLGRSCRLAYAPPKAWRCPDTSLKKRPYRGALCPASEQETSSRVLPTGPVHPRKGAAPVDREIGNVLPNRRDAKGSIKWSAAMVAGAESPPEVEAEGAGYASASEVFAWCPQVGHRRILGGDRRHPPPRSRGNWLGRRQRTVSGIPLGEP